jgi:hypothetical protein
MLGGGRGRCCRWQLLLLLLLLLLVGRVVWVRRVC